MCDLRGPSLRARFSISPNLLFAVSEVVVPPQAPPQCYIPDGVVTQRADDGMSGLELTSRPEPTLTSSECCTCLDLIDRLHAVPSQEFAGPDLQIDVQQHYRYHDPFVSMDPKFAGFGYLMVKTCQWTDETAIGDNVEKLGFRDHGPLVEQQIFLSPHVVAEDMQMLDLQDPTYGHDSTAIDMGICGMFSNHSQHNFNPEINETSQALADILLSSPYDRTKILRYAEVCSAANLRAANAWRLSNTPEDCLSDARSDSTLEPNDAGSNGDYGAAKEREYQKALKRSLTPKKHFKTPRSAYVDCQSELESCSSLLPASDCSFATGPDETPAQAALARQYRAQAKVRANPFKYLRSVHLPRGNKVERKLMRTQRIELWIIAVEAAHELDL